MTREEGASVRPGRPVLLEDIWPKDADIRACIDGALTQDLFRDADDVLADPGPGWSEIPHARTAVYPWASDSMFLRRPPFLDRQLDAVAPILGARILLMLGDNVTTDHISPGSSIPSNPIRLRHHRIYAHWNLRGPQAFPLGCVIVCADAGSAFCA